MIRQINEILADRALVAIGALLAVTHLLHAVAWNHPLFMNIMIGKGTYGVCYPFLPDCARWRFLTLTQIPWLIWGYGAGALACLASFFFKPGRRLALLLLILLQITKNAIIFSDVRLYSAHNYITNFLYLIYFLSSRKRERLRLFFVLVYFWSGVLHFKKQWFDGTILRPVWSLFLPTLKLQAAYVVFLELCVSWGLLTENCWIFWACFMQFIAFHALSLTAIHWLYPAVMFALLPSLVFLRVFPNLKRISSDPVGAWILIAFSILQLVPRLLGERGALTGDGRYYYAMHQFHTSVSCEAKAMVRYASGREEEKDLLTVLPFIHLRLTCEPVVAISATRALCQQRGDVAAIKMELKSKLDGDPGPYQTILSAEGPCAETLSRLDSR